MIKDIHLKKDLNLVLTTGPLPLCDLCPLCGKGHMITVERLLPLRFPLVRPPPEIKKDNINA